MLSRMNKKTRSFIFGEGKKALVFWSHYEKREIWTVTAYQGEHCG